MARLDNNLNLLRVTGNANGANSVFPPATGLTGFWVENGKPQFSLATELNGEPLVKGMNTADARALLKQEFPGTFPVCGQPGFSDPVETFTEEELRALQLPARPAEVDFLPEVSGSARSQEHLRLAQALLATRAAALELSLTERTDRLAETNRALEAMCAALADTLREPLRSVTEPNGALEGNGKDYAQRVARAAERLDGLIEGLLKYGQLSREEPAWETVSLEAAVGMVVEDMEGAIAARRAEVHTQGPLPRVRAHPARLRQVLGQLIDNALKFVPRDVTPRVRIRSESGPETVRVYVEDNGIGVPREQHERIFGLFQRLSDNHPGIGVGLALVRKAVERMGGQTGVESEPGKGSRFWIELPKGR